MEEEEKKQSDGEEIVDYGSHKQSEPQYENSEHSQDDSKILEASQQRGFMANQSPPSRRSAEENLHPIEVQQQAHQQLHH